MKINILNRIKIKFTLLFLALLLNTLIVNVIAEESIYGHGYFEYVLEDDGVAIVNYLGNENEVYVPEEIASFPVYKICTRSFMNCDNTQVLYLPDTIIEIDENSISDSIEIIFNYNVQNNEINDNRVDIPISEEEHKNNTHSSIEIDDDNKEESSIEIYEASANDGNDIEADYNKEEDIEEDNVGVDNAVIDNDYDNYLLYSIVTAFTVAILILLLLVIKNRKRK